MIRAAWAVLFLALAGHAPAGVVVPCEVASQTVAAKAEPATIDQLMKQLVDIRAQKAEIEKREKATLAELKQRLELLRDLLKDLDVEPAPTPTPAPKPKPDDVKPAPVTSFRVLYIVERMATLTPGQNAVVHGAEVERFLDARTTKTDDTRGWRRIDPHAPTDGDTPTFNALWASVKPSVTAVPCVAVEINGKVEIVPLEETPAKMVAKFKSYLGEK
jgi:hypothetical protein